MREIKFRLWNETSSIYGYTDKGLKLVFPNIANREHLILEQYTGLKDKNGKEIYEGDIVLFKDMYHLEGTKEYRLEVYFNEYGEWCAGNMLLSRLFTEKTLEVVGNIHQNADLLEVENEN